MHMHAPRRAVGSQAEKDADLGYVHWVKDTKDAGKARGAF